MKEEFIESSCGNPPPYLEGRENPFSLSSDADIINHLFKAESREQENILDRILWREAAERMKRLIRERDHSRRQACENKIPTFIFGVEPRDQPRALAKHMGWDCYGESESSDS